MQSALQHNDERPPRSLVVAVLPFALLVVAWTAFTTAAAAIGASTDQAGFKGNSPGSWSALYGPFVHGSFLHLAMNALVGAPFAVALSTGNATARFAKVWGLFAAGALAGEVLWVLSGSTVALLGASAGVCAWIGAVAVWRIPVGRKVWAAALALLVVSALTAPAAGAVHAAGAVAGAGVAGWVRWRSMRHDHHELS